MQNIFIRAINLNKTEQAIICFFIFLVLCSLLYQFAIFPELKRARSARFQLDFQQNLLNLETAESQHRDALNDSVQKLKDEIARIHNSLFGEAEARAFLKSIYQLINQTGSALTIMTPHNIQEILSTDAQNLKKVKGETPPFMTMPVKIAIRGDYSAVIRLLEKLRQHSKLMTISKLNIATARNPSEVNAEFTLRLYVYEDQEI